MNRPSQFPPFDGPGFGAEPTEHRTEPTRDVLPPGTQLDEYEILSVLDEGESGIVYRAIDHGLQREVAIKEYLPAALAFRDRGTGVTLRSHAHAEAFALGLKSFIAEARLLGRVDHPALMPVYRFWEANRTAYRVTPYYHGVTLRVAREAMERPPDEAWMHGLLLPLLGALDALHGASCHPGNISPDNILLLPDGRPVLMDIGAAPALGGDRNEADAPTLEAAFAPIEQYPESTGLERGPWTSLYALAAVAYYCVGGRPPPAATDRAVDDRMEPLFEVVDRLGRSFPDLNYSVAFVSAIERALNVRPDERPRSVAEFRRALLGSRAAAESAVMPPAAVDDAGPFRAPHTLQSPDSRWRAGEDSALGPDPEASGDAQQFVIDPEDAGGYPRTGGDAEPRLRRRAALVVAAVAALAVLGAGGWMLRSSVRDARMEPSSAAVGTEPEARPTALPPSGSPSAAVGVEPEARSSAPPSEPPPTVRPEASAALPAVPPAGAAAEPQSPPVAAAPEAAARDQAPPPVVSSKTTEAEVPPAGTSPEPPAVAEPALSPPSTARVAAKEANKETNNPRVLCGPRTQFSLYRCMKEACDRSKYYDHAECRYLRATDEVRALP